MKGIINTIAGPVAIIDWDQYLFAISDERAMQIVEEYNMLTSYGSTAGSAFFEESNIPPVEEDSTYYRASVEVKNASNKLFRQQFKDQIKTSPRIKAQDFVWSIEEASVKFMENFGDVKLLACVSMGNGEYVLAPFERDYILIKKLTPFHGALVVYRPNNFIKFKSKFDEKALLKKTRTVVEQFDALRGNY